MQHNSVWHYVGTLTVSYSVSIFKKLSVF